MSIPLDLLYNFIKNLCQTVFGEQVLLYRFYPYGSKKLSDLQPLCKQTFLEGLILPAVFCNDQEPLNHELYISTTPGDKGRTLSRPDQPLPGVIRSFKNLETIGDQGIFEKGLLIHSEKRSLEIEKYLQDDRLILVYYWSHALIALDWYRGACHMNFSKSFNQEKKCFLIYNRAWSGTREYRLKLLDLLIDQELVGDCQTTFNEIDPEGKLHYLDYLCKNPAWQPQHSLTGYFPTTTATGMASADFSISDYTGTEIEIVLETLFDDNRLHLTEKSLRPIACGQPFLMAATHGSLQYLRDYGFRTFDTVWDESYDLIIDPATRLEAVVKTMKTISRWDTETKATKLQQANEIADYNRKWFFNQDFFNSIVHELEQNLTHAFHELDHNTQGNYISFLQHYNSLYPFEQLSTIDSSSQLLRRRMAGILGTERMETIELAMKICRFRLSHGRNQMQNKVLHKNKS